MLERPILPLLLILASSILVPELAFAQQQNLIVRPMKVEAEVPPNRVARVLLSVRNRHETRTEPVNVEVVHLTQSRDGSLRILTEEMLAENFTQEEGERLLSSSSRDWVTLPANRVEIAPETTADIPVMLRVPPRSRGTFVSAVRLLTDEPEMPEGTGAEREAVFAIRFGFLVPFITGIQGAAVRQNISISDIAMEFDNGTDDDGNELRQPSTRVSMEIANDGQTYSDLDAEIRVERRSGENWRLVTSADLPRLKILPGVTLELVTDLERRLPSGEYRLIGNLMVDGRRTPRLEKVIDFEGDPESDRIAFDTLLLMEPSSISLDAVPGATRTSGVTITNPGDQPLSIEISASSPDEFSGKAMGEIMGDDLSAAGWTEIRPSEFILRPGQRRNVRVMSRLPREGVAYPNYYADLILAGSYEDGQSAGSTQSLLHVNRSDVESNPGGLIERLSMAEGEDAGQFFAQLRFINTGNVHLHPSGSLQLRGADGSMVASSRLTGDDAPVLPLGTRDLAAELDLSDVEPGNYLLSTAAEFEPDGRIAKDQVLVLTLDETEGEDGKTVKRPAVVVLDPAVDELPDGFTIPGAIEDGSENPDDRAGGLLEGIGNRLWQWACVGSCQP